MQNFWRPDSSQPEAQLHYMWECCPQGYCLRQTIVKKK